MQRSETLIPLNSGAYQARSPIADYQVCENLFPEVNPAETDPDVAVTHYPREGLRPLSAPPLAAPGRGIFTLSNGTLYAVAGDTLYFIDQDWKWNVVGQIGNQTTPVSMSDNGTSAVLVDGTQAGYTVKMADRTFSHLFDPTGTFSGSRRVDFADTFLAFATPQTNEWFVSLSNQVSFNALVIAAKDSSPDPIQTLGYNMRQMWLLGRKNSEVWYLTGATPFPYAAWPNVQVPFGCVAPYSLVRADIDLFWLSQNDQGQAIAVKTEGYAVNAISTRALEYEWSNYPTVADVVAGTFQRGGHTFIVFHFPSADTTWAYDLATKQWHRRTSIDQNGVVHRDRAAFYASVGDAGGYQRTIVGQDWQTGQIYALDPTFYTDNGMPIVFRRSFPHVMKDMHEITNLLFVADFETGGIVGTTEAALAAGSPWSNAFSNAFGPLTGAVQAGSSPMLCMRYSNNGGSTFGNYRQKGLIGSGRYRSMMRWRGLGMARDRVYELMWAYPGPSALQGAYVEALEHSA